MSLSAEGKALVSKHLGRPIAGSDMEDVERTLGLNSVNKVLDGTFTRQCTFCGEDIKGVPLKWVTREMHPEWFCSIEHRNAGNVLRGESDLLPVLDVRVWAEREPPRREWLVPDWIPMRQATYLTGSGSAGKSLLAQQLCTCVAAGVPFLGLPVEKGTALYVTCEDDSAELEFRQRGICDGLRISPRAIEGRMLPVSLMGEIDNELIRWDATGKPVQTESFDRLARTIDEFEARLVVLDNVAHLTGEEIERSKVAAFVNLLNRLASNMAGGAVLFLGHPNKSGDDYSGSTAWENQVRSRLFLAVADDHDIDTRTLTRAKSNYARRGDNINFRWHRWAFVRPEDLGDDVRLELEETARATADNAAFLECLRVRLSQRRPVSENKASRTYAPLEFSQMVEAKGISKVRLERAMDRLFRTQTIERGFLWREDGKDKTGLRETAADLPADPPRTVAADPRAVLTPTPAHTHPIPKGTTGAAPQVAAPVTAQPPIFPADDDDPAADALLRD